MLKKADKINFQCASCDCRFWIETNRVAAGQQVSCPNCERNYDKAYTEPIGKAAKALFNAEPVGFTWWME